MRARLFLLSAALLWSTAGAAIKLTGLSSFQLAAGRSAIAGAALFALLPSARRLPARHTLWVVLAYALTVSFFVAANKLTTAANAIFLQYTAPLYVLVLSTWVVGERPSRSELLAAPVYLAGLGMFFADQLAPGQLLGNALAALAGVAFGLFILGLRRAHASSGPLLVAGNFATAFFLAPLALSGPRPTPLDWGVLAFLGLFQLGLAYWLFSRGLSQVPAIEASLLVLIEPVLNPVWTFLVAGERPGPWALCGGAVILAATLWRTLRARPAPQSA